MLTIDTIASITTLQQARATAKEIMASYDVKIPLAGKGRTIAAIKADCLEAISSELLAISSESVNLDEGLNYQSSALTCDVCNYQHCDLPEVEPSFEPLANSSELTANSYSVASTADTLVESIIKDAKACLSKAIATVKTIATCAIAFTQGFCSVMFGGKKAISY